MNRRTFLELAATLAWGVATLPPWPLWSGFMRIVECVTPKPEANQPGVFPVTFPITFPEHRSVNNENRVNLPIVRS